MASIKENLQNDPIAITREVISYLGEHYRLLVINNHYFQYYIIEEWRGTELTFNLLKTKMYTNEQEASLAWYNIETSMKRDIKDFENKVKEIKDRKAQRK